MCIKKIHECYIILYIIVVNESVVMWSVIVLTYYGCISFVIDVCAVESIYMITVTVVVRSNAAFVQTCIHTHIHMWIIIIISESKCLWMNIYGECKHKLCTRIRMG